MDKAELAELLNRGLSLRAIAERFGKDRSTVGYWVRQHGLVANGRDKHAPRGAVTKAALVQAIAAGMTLRELASEFDCSSSTVQYWLRKYELKTARSHQALALNEAGETLGSCRAHGVTVFVREGRGYHRCRECRKQRVIEWRRRAKLRLVAEAGGRCRICGYERYAGALHFHHVDPSQKSFGLATRGLTKSIARLRAEAAKCVLLCSNCHAEVEAGIVDLPLRQMSGGAVPQIAGAE